MKKTIIEMNKIKINKSEVMYRRSLNKTKENKQMKMNIIGMNQMRMNQNERKKKRQIKKTD